MGTKLKMISNILIKFSIQYKIKKGIFKRHPSTHKQMFNCKLSFSIVPKQQTNKG